MTRFALLLLLGAAPPATDITAAASCTLSQAETEAAFRALPLASTEDDSEADESGTIYGFTPAGTILWDAPASRVQLFVYTNRTEGDVTQRYEVAFPGAYDAMRDNLFAASARTKCDREIGGTGARSCELALGGDGPWRRSVALIESNGTLTLSCAFGKSGG